MGVSDASQSVGGKRKKPVTIEITGFFGAVTQIRTGDLILTKDALYRLSYNSISHAPKNGGMVATEKGLEPSTSGVTGRRSNRLNYSATAPLIYQIYRSLSIGFEKIF